MTNAAHVTALLGKSELFGSLTAADRSMIAQKMRAGTFVAGEFIFARGDPGAEIYLVLEGRVRFSVFSVDGRSLSFNHARAGEIFGEIAALDGGVRTADAIALSRVQTMTLPQTALNRLIEMNPRIARAAIAFLCRRLRVMSERSEAIALRPVHVRLARFLMSELKVRELSGQVANAPLDLEMPQNELALLMGASRQKVNAALAYLEKAGAVKRTKGLLVCDAKELARLAEAF